jgi:hypothetical protein
MMALIQQVPVEVQKHSPFQVVSTRLNSTGVEPAYSLGAMVNVLNPVI